MIFHNTIRMFLQFIIIFWLKYTCSEITDDHLFIYDNGYNHYQLFHIICKLDDDNYFVGIDTERDNVAFKLNNTDCRTLDDQCFIGSMMTIDCYTNHLEKILDSDYRPLIDKVKNKLSYDIIKTIYNDCPNMCQINNGTVDIKQFLIVMSIFTGPYIICCIIYCVGIYCNRKTYQSSENKTCCIISCINKCRKTKFFRSSTNNIETAPIKSYDPSINKYADA